MDYFVPKGSVVRKIWGSSDTILFVFGGAAAEFALNKAVDWLYYTGRLPSDPLGRLFSTVTYARRIVFATTEDAHKAIDQISGIHGALEKSRGYKIPDWAYRDVLYMLIHYSVAAYELLERKMSDAEKEEIYDVFYRMGTRMHLRELPGTYTAWQASRAQHLEQDLAMSDYTIDLFKQYKKHLGGFRYFVLRESQKLVVPLRVRVLLRMQRLSMASPLLFFYKTSRRIGLAGLVKRLLLPATYYQQIRELDYEP